MKIGIVTYHRTLNYGAVMQSLATRFILQEMGHEVYYVDYWPDYHRESYALFPMKKFMKYDILQKGKYLLMFVKLFKSKKRRIFNFEKFFQSQIYPYCRPVDSSFDIVVYGSDQIWRKQKSLGTYNPFYFGDNLIKTNHHISYAASMGILPDNEADKVKLKKLVSHIEKISVREEELQLLLLSLGFEDVSLSLDPTLLLSSKEWDKYLPTEKYIGEKYALMYILSSDAFDIKEVKKFTDSKGLKLIILRGNATTKETSTNITSAGPYEFIRLMKNAEYVFCVSFHGLAFSIIYEKQFYTSFTSNAGRAVSLLKQLGIERRMLAPKSPIPQNEMLIDYNIVRNKLEALSKESLEFLNELKNVHL